MKPKSDVNELIHQYENVQIDRVSFLSSLKSKLDDNNSIAISELIVDNYIEKGLHVRKASLKDLENIYWIQKIELEDNAMTKDQIASMIENSVLCFILERFDNKILPIGYISIHVLGDCIHPSIKNFFVLPEYRSEGYGSYLLLKSLQSLPETVRNVDNHDGFYELNKCSVRINNSKTRIVKFFKNHEFKTIDPEGVFIKTPTDMIYMVRELTLGFDDDSLHSCLNPSIIKEIEMRNNTWIREDPASSQLLLKICDILESTNNPRAEDLLEIMENLFYDNDEFSYLVPIESMILHFLKLLISSPAYHRGAISINYNHNEPYPFSIDGLSIRVNLSLNNFNFLKFFPNLKKLTLMNQKSKNAPDIKYLRNLEELILQNNEFLGGLPASIKNLESLR